MREFRQRRSTSKSNDNVRKSFGSFRGFCFFRSTSGVDFNELLRKGAEKKRAEMREERRKREEVKLYLIFVDRSMNFCLFKAEEKRQQERIRAEEAFQRWVSDKNASRKRFNDEKRLEREQLEVKFSFFKKHF